ncbi:MAG: HAMP domain-containing sensor histidine kinase [Candidatus Hydrogenedentota bacterium]
MPEREELSFDDQMRDKLARLYRYAQVGHCVSSVTHDVNNFLGAILAYAELVKMEENLTPESQRMLAEIMEAVQKSTRLISSLTDIARRERPDIRVVSPREVVEAALDLRRYDLKVAHIEIETDFGNNLWEITVDLPKLQQAFIYLLSNAVEALEEARDRRLKVSVLADDDWVQFGFWNSGREIDEAVCRRMFEPFFTTKGDDHLGLGLWAARSNLRLHNGDVRYERDDGFLVVLPREGDDSAITRGDSQSEKT